MNTINKLVVIGAGILGCGITNVFSQVRFRVFLVNSEQDFLDWSLNSINNNLDQHIKKGIITSEQENSFLSNIITLVEYKNIERYINIIIEVIYEDRKVNLLSLKDLDNLVNVNSIMYLIILQFQ